MNEKRSLRLANRYSDKPAVLYEDVDLPDWIIKEIDTPVGKVRVVPTTLRHKDHLDGCKVRWGINRYDYRISPGLYAIGEPDSTSEVIVTANYKLTFDMLRKELSGRHLWVVVIDTKGINVWCAAGKGTFGTAEIINRIKKVQLEKVVGHRRIILPQLGAPGVSAHTVTKMTGFGVVYGPIYASDLGSFLDEGLKAADSMRQVKFELYDRLVLTPMEIVISLKYVPIIYIGWLLFNAAGIGTNGFVKVALASIMNALPYFIAILIGTFLVPVLLPWIPFKAFSLKGALLGILWSAVCIFERRFFGYDSSILQLLGNSMLLTALISFLALNFTGCTTFTSLSGVKLETKWATIIAGLSGIIGLLMLIAHTIGGILG